LPYLARNSQLCLIQPPGSLPDARGWQSGRPPAVVISAEALFVLTDLCGLSPDEAVASAARTAAALTGAAFGQDPG